MARARNGGTEIEYDTLGDPADPAVLLIAGLGTQLINWEDGFVRALAERGRFVIRYDNRDAGLSTRSPGPTPTLEALMVAAAGGTPDSPASYSLADMAGDGLAVLDEIGVDRANVVGSSMGGMIGQTVAIEHPDRVVTLTSIMSTTGAADVGRSAPEAIGALLTPGPADRAGAIERTVELRRVLSGPLFDEDKARRMAVVSHDRSFNPLGVLHQLAAILADGDRTTRLASVTIPTLVIHGEVDPLIDVSGGRATAAAVPGARLLTLAPMGHDLPEPLWPEIVDAIIGHTAVTPAR